MNKKLIKYVSVFLLLTMLLLTVGCGGNELYENSKSVSGEVQLSVSSSKRLGTGKGKVEEEAISAAFSASCDEFERAWALLEPLSTENSLSKINSEADVILDCDSELIDVLCQVMDLNALTSGAYEPCCGAYTLANTDEMSEEASSEALSHVGCDKISISENTVKKLDRKAAFDLYAVREGYALGLAVKKFEEAGSMYGTLNASNTVAVFGEKPKGETFNIAVLDDDGETVGWFCIPGGYVSVISEDSVRRKGGGEFSRVAVYAADGVSAGAIAEAIICGEADTLEMLENKIGGSFDAAAVRPDGSVFVSEGAVDSGVFRLREKDGTK